MCAILHFMKPILNYRIIIEKDGPYYHGYAPSLSGCHTQGKTIPQTRKNLREAIEGWLETSIAHQFTIPKPDTIEKIEDVESIDTRRLPGFTTSVKYA